MRYDPGCRRSATPLRPRINNSGGAQFTLWAAWGRIAVKGASGSGNTTFAAELGQRLGVGHFELDALHHGPNWDEPSAQEFCARVRAAMDANPEAWVIDGNYESKLDALVTDASGLVVWLDMPRGMMLNRLWSRTSRRIHVRRQLPAVAAIRSGSL